MKRWNWVLPRQNSISPLGRSAWVVCGDPSADSDEENSPVFPKHIISGLRCRAGRPENLVLHLLQSLQPCPSRFRGILGAKRVQCYGLSYSREEDTSR